MDEDTDTDDHTWTENKNTSPMVQTPKEEKGQKTKAQVSKEEIQDQWKEKVDMVEPTPHPPPKNKKCSRPPKEQRELKEVESECKRKRHRNLRSKKTKQNIPSLGWTYPRTLRKKIIIWPA